MGPAVDPMTVLSTHRVGLVELWARRMLVGIDSSRVPALLSRGYYGSSAMNCMPDVCDGRSHFI